jgi:hypothetical protein
MVSSNPSNQLIAMRPPGHLLTYYLLVMIHVSTTRKVERIYASQVQRYVNIGCMDGHLLTIDLLTIDWQTYYDDASSDYKSSKPHMRLYGGIRLVPLWVLISPPLPIYVHQWKMRMGHPIP